MESKIMKSGNSLSMNRIRRQSVFMSIWDFRHTKEPTVTKKEIRIRFCI